MRIEALVCVENYLSCLSSWRNGVWMLGQEIRSKGSLICVVGEAQPDVADVADIAPFSPTFVHPGGCCLVFYAD